MQTAINLITLAILVVFALIGLFAVMFGLTLWFDHIDSGLRQSAIRYEACVQREYRMLPIHWYEQHGYYPECDTL